MADYAHLLSQFNIPTLADRRLCLSLCTTYKIINELVDFTQNTYLLKSPTNLRSSNASLLLQPFARTNAYQFSFVPLSCSVWNKLPKQFSFSSGLQTLTQETHPIIIGNCTLTSCISFSGMLFISLKLFALCIKSYRIEKKKKKKKSTQATKQIVYSARSIQAAAHKARSPANRP